MKQNKIDQDAFYTIRQVLKLYDLQSVADAADVHVSTLYNWIEKRYNPLYTTLIKVAYVLGYEINVTAIKVRPQNKNIK